MPESNSSRGELVAELRGEIERLGPGRRLPSTRALVERHRVSPVTVSRALGVLAAEGLVLTRPGAGTFTAEPAAAAAPIDLGWQTAALPGREVDVRELPSVDGPVPESMVSMGTGYLHPTLMPTRALAAATARAGRRPGVWDLPPANGLTALRTWIAQAVGGAIDARDVTITPGGQGGLSTVLRALVPAGEPMLVESPSYPGATAVLRAAGIRPVPVPIDADGVRPELLDTAFERTRARAVLLQPTYHNPTGAVLAPGRRAEVLAIASRRGAFIVEDDYARWLGHEATVPPPLLHDDTEGRVIHISSLTKVTSPNLRIGAVIARGPVIERVRALRLVADLVVSRLLQEAALELVSGPAWARHLRALRTILAERCATVVRGLAADLPGARLTARPRGGLHVWLRLPDDLDDIATRETAARAGVVITAGRRFFPAEPPAPHLRLTFSAAADEADLTEGLRRLGAAVPELGAAGRR